MRFQTRRIPAAIVALLVVGFLATQVAGEQGPRDRRPDQPQEWGVIQGRVTTPDGRPVRMATVRVSPWSRDVDSVTQTDGDGTYQLSLPAGRYTIRSSKDGLVSVEFGQQRVDEGGTVIELSAGKTVDDIDFRLPPGGVLTGLVVDGYGDPATGARVQALRYRFSSGQWQLVPAGRGDSTDDRGVFRVFGLAPGDYYLEAAFGALRPSGVAEENRYAPTFYPTGADPDSAQPIHLELGQELSGLDVQLTSIRTARVTGRVLSPRGSPDTRPTVSMLPNGLAARSWPMTAQVEREGTFAISGVPPGEYTVYATVGSADARQFARTLVRVTGYDVDGVVLRMEIGAAARGRLFFETGASPDFHPSALQPFTMPPGFDRLPIGRGIGHVNDDWTFEIRGMGGPQLVRLVGLPVGWELRTVELAGRDITDMAVEFSTQRPTTGLNLLISHRTTAVTGRVIDGNGRPEADATVVVFADDADRWPFPSRVVRASRVDRDGGFAFEGLPPARYLAVAARPVPDGAWTDPLFLRGLRPLSVSLGVGPGQKQHLQLSARTLR